MPVAVAPNSAKSVRPGVSVGHDGSLVIVACHRVPQAAQPSATCPWKGPRATRGQMSWSAGTQCKPPPTSTLSGLLSCRGCYLAGSGSLSLSESRRGARCATIYLLKCYSLAFLASSSRQGLVL